MNYNAYSSFSMIHFPENIANLYSTKNISHFTEEIFEPIIQTPDLLIERIISAGQITPPEQWYDQERDEWVALLQGSATIQYESGELHHLKPGDHLTIPAHCRHRVEFTSIEPVCVWLAVHGRFMATTIVRESN